MLQSDNQFGGTMFSAEKVQFFDKLDDQGLAVTYDDVRLCTRAATHELPKILDVTSRFSRNVELKLPFVSSPMDTVTNSAMAIEMAKLGGIGVIHANQSIEEQYDQVRKVKYAVNGLIEEPKTADESETLESVLGRCDRHGWPFRSFPVVNNEGRLVGLLTGSDFQFADSMQTLVSEAMKPADQVAQASVGTTLEEAYGIMQQRKAGTLPVIAADGAVAGLYLFTNVSSIYRHADMFNRDDQKRLRVAAAVSTGSNGMERAERLVKYADVLVIDTADGDSSYVFEMLQHLKATYDVDVVVGNISDGPSARLLAEAGADGIRVGQGGGAICTTRREAGIGKPQVSAVYDAARELEADFPDIPVCADGGIKEHGDIPIAFGAGAHNVMMGRVLAGTTEAPGKIVTKSNGSRFKLYRGMGSAAALRENEASRERYGVTANGNFLAEGVESLVPYVGDVASVIDLCVQALRKSMRYVKAENITQLRNEARFMRLTDAGLRESHPHDVEVLN
jgi:IMP dehydrogenase